jgi:hypothetical protein
LPIAWPKGQGRVLANSRQGLDTPAVRRSSRIADIKPLK